MIHPQTEVRLVSVEVGRGVVATTRLPRGTIVWVRDPLDGGWPVRDVMRWPDAYRSILYQTCFVLGDEVVQPWDDARYMNHSCEPSCAGTEYGFEVALRDIEPGEPLSNDYDGFGLPGEPPFVCHCGATSCRGRDVFRAPDLARGRLAAALALALKEVRGVPQPLIDLLQPRQLEHALATLDARRARRSNDDPGLAKETVSPADWRTRRSSGGTSPD